MRRGLLIALIVVVVVAVGGLLIISSGIDRYRPQIQSQLEKTLGRPVQLGHLSLHLLPLSLKIDGLSIQEDPSFQSPNPFAQANQVFVSVGLFSLLSGNPELQSLQLDKPRIELIKNANGVWNYSTLGSSSNNKQSSNTQLSLDHFQVTDGQIGYTDRTTAQSRSVYDHVDVDVRHLAPQKPFDLKVGAHLPGQGKQILEFDGKVGPLNTQTAALTPVKGRLKLEELTLAGLNQFAPGLIPQGDDAVASGEADISSQNQALKCKGDLKLTNPVFGGAKLDFPISARYQFDADRTANNINIQSASIGLGQTTFNLSGNYNAGTKPASVNLTLANQNSSLAELARLAGALHVAFGSEYNIKGSISTNLKITGPVTAPLFNGTINARNIDVSGGEIKTAVQVPSIDLALTPQTVRSNAFTAKSGSTELQAQIALTNYSTTSRSVDASAKTSNADLAELMNMAKAYGFDASKGATGSGKVSFNLHVQGPLANLSSLQFAGNADLNNATIQSPQLTKPVAVHSASLQFSQNSVAASNLNASIGSTTLSGTLSAKSFEAPQLTFALSANTLDTTELQNLTRPTNSGAKASAPAHLDSLLQKTTGSGTLAAGTIKAENLVLTNFHANCKLDHGLIQLSPVTTDLFGGKETGTISFDARPANPLVGLNVKLSGVDSNALLSAVSNVKDTLFGSLAADTNLRFTLLNSSADLAKTLNGRLSFNVTNGRLKNVNILNEISKVGKFLGNAPGQSSSDTALKRLSGTMEITNGAASTNDLVAGLDVGSLSAKGVINLADQGLNMHVNAVLAQSTSQTVGGSSVGGYLNTALANNKGELVLPVIVTGTTAHPVFAPDVQALAQMKLNNLLPTLNDPSKLTSGIVGAISGKQGAGSVLNQILGGGANKQGQKNTAPSQDSADPLKSILGQFGKKKPKNQ